MKKNIIRIAILIGVIGLIYLLFYPVPIDPGAWHPDPAPEFTGELAPNDHLGKVKKMGECYQCEDVAIDKSGNMYASAADGNIIFFSADFSERRVIANTGGRPLGMVIDAANNIYVADDTKGLLHITLDGKVTLLTNSYNKQKMLFLDDLALLPDSTIAFTEASRKFTDSEFVLDIIEHQPNGHLFSYDLKTGTTNLLIDSLFFGNGVAVSMDSSYLLVNNMNKYQVLKYYLEGDKKGTYDIFLDNLPGFPDGVNIAADETIWVSIPTLRINILDKLLPYPFLRKVALRLPQSNNTPAFGFILGFNKEGKLIKNLQDPNQWFTGITNTVPHKNKLILGSIREDQIGVYELDQ